MTPVVRVGMAPRRAGMTPEEFRHHYAAVHSGVANQVPGVRRYVQWHALTDDSGRRPLPYPGFDACSTMDFDSFDDLTNGFASATYQGAVRNDERNFVDPEKHSRIVGVRLVDAEVPKDHVALVTLWRRHPEADDRSWREAIDNWADSPGGQLVEIVLGLDEPPDGRPNAADLVTIRAFATAASAIDWALSEGSSGSDPWPLSRQIFGSATFIARPHRVV